MLDAWNRRLPDDYPLIVKGPRSITHVAKLQDCQALVEDFWGRVSQLRTLRVVLWQLPPLLTGDAALLDRFLGDLSPQVRHAFEFRHVSWWTPEVCEVLARHRAAMVAASHPNLPVALLPTTDFLYLRFHGLGKELYHYGLFLPGTERVGGPRPTVLGQPHGLWDLQQLLRGECRAQRPPVPAAIGRRLSGGVPRQFSRPFPSFTMELQTPRCPCRPSPWKEFAHEPC